MLRVIGDTHGLIGRFPSRDYLAPQAEGRNYLKVIDGVEHTLQLGDMGWRESLEPLKGVDPYKHKVILGNHDDYDNIIPHSLGDYGIYNHGGITFGFIRGEFSIDKYYRAWDGPHKTWWQQEELTYSQFHDALDYFDTRRDIKLDFMFTHGCPASLFHLGILSNPGKFQPSTTAKFLDAFFSTYKPKYWIFGHHHNNWRQEVDGTNFICLNELCYVDISDSGEVSETV